MEGVVEGGWYGGGGRGRLVWRGWFREGGMEGVV